MLGLRLLGLGPGTPRAPSRRRCRSFSIDIPTSADHLLVATISHDGSSNFAIESHSADGDRDLLVNEIGSYDGTVRMSDAVALEINADGNWTIDAE